MALRLRKNGHLFCAALCKEEDGDIYIEDQLHYELSVIYGIIVTEPIKKHLQSGEWWWVGNIPKNIKLEFLR